jgi:hypothetical protein
VSILDQAITPRRPVQRNDDSAVSLLSLPMLNSARRDSPLESTLPPFIPALRIDGQSLPQGKCITSASEGQELHLYANQVIKDIIGLCLPSLICRSFRENGSHGHRVVVGVANAAHRWLALIPARCWRLEYRKHMNYEGIETRLRTVHIGLVFSLTL